jgi:nucleoredoxin
MMSYPKLLLSLLSLATCALHLNADATAPSSLAPALNVSTLLEGKCVVPVQDKKIAKATGLFTAFSPDKAYDYYLVYFSASWCGPCKLFTPKLKAFYNDQKLTDHGIQVLLVSRDYTEQNLWDYMVSAQMPWPALAFEWRDRLDFINKLAGSGLPSLVLIDAAGNVLADSFDGPKYLGPQSVLDYVARMLFKKEKAAAMPSQPMPRNSDELREALGMDSLPTIP